MWKTFNSSLNNTHIKATILEITKSFSSVLEKQTKVAYAQIFHLHAKYIGTILFIG